MSDQWMAIRQLVGTVVTTVRGEEFTLDAVDEQSTSRAISLTPHRTGQSRSIPRADVEKAFAYLETGEPISPSRLQSAEVSTHHATYVAAILRALSSAPKTMLGESTALQERTPPMSTLGESTIASDLWHWEGAVQEQLAAHLSREGWTVERTSNTASREQGIDILLTKASRRLIVEVKGFPSTVYERGPKRGQAKPTHPANQARQWFSHALLSVLSYRGTTTDEVAIGIPDSGTYRNLLEKTKEPLRILGIGVYIVYSNGSVERFLNHERG